MNKFVIAVFDGIEITLREVLVSIIIVLFMAAAGFMISEKISSTLDERNEEYEQAVKIENDRELFEYGMRTNVGNAFVSGTLKTLDPISLTEIDGEYSSITKTKEEYTKHTRTVTDYDENGEVKGHHEEVYYTWDAVGHENYYATKISFLDVEFDYGKIEFPGQSYLTTIKVSSDVRYVYRVCGTEFKGTIYTKLGDNTISKADFYNNQNTSEAFETACNTSKALLIGFWIIWIVLIGAAVFGFVSFDNDWIEGD